jgi:peptidoglycan/xylan/chitin deacetylase (PgdA/CDA1 family)
VLRRALAFAIRWSGLAWLIRNTYGRRRVAIVLYHDPSPEVLERQLAWLRRGYEIIGLDTLVDAIHSGDWAEVPPRSVVLTIDDGHSGNRALAEVLRADRVRPTIFVCSRIVGTARRFWFEGLPAAAAESLKSVPDERRLAKLAERWDFSPEREYPGSPPQALSRAEIAEMLDCCDFQSHTATHPILLRCTAERAREEIEASRREVEEMTGALCAHLAYPNGCYSDREAILAREAGYRSARTVDIGWNHAGTDPYRLRILSVADDASPTVLAAELAGLKWLSRLWRREGRLDGRFQPRWNEPSGEGGGILGRDAEEGRPEGQQQP